MFVDLPHNLILYTAAAFLLGWLLSSIFGAMGSRSSSKKRDPRDDRIRSLEAEHRVAQTDLEKARDKVDELQKELENASDDIEKRDNVISHQQARMEETTRDLRESVMKTRELRAELSERATENLKSEVALRDAKTELEVVRASSDMIATGVLDYSMAQVDEANDDDGDLLDESDMTEAST